VRKCGGHKLAQVGIGTERLLLGLEAVEGGAGRAARLGRDPKARCVCGGLSGMQRGEVDISSGRR